MFGELIGLLAKLWFLWVIIGLFIVLPAKLIYEEYLRQKEHNDKVTLIEITIQSFKDFAKWIIFTAAPWLLVPIVLFWLFDAFTGGPSDQYLDIQPRR